MLNFFRKKAQYEPISTNENYTTQNGKGADDDNPPVANQSYMMVTLCIIIFCTTANVLAILWAVHSVGIRSSVRPVIELKPQDSYFNLDKVYKNKSSAFNVTFPPIITHSRFFTQVSSMEPERILTSNEPLLVDDYGRFPYYTRRLRLGPTVSTVVQFRVKDYGMEKCALTLSLPPRNETEETTNSKSSGRSAQQIAVWKFVTSGLPIDQSKLSWSTRPKQRQFFATMPIQYGSSYSTATFPCPSMSWQAFELACISADCHLDIESVGVEESGLYMQQYQSI